MLLLHSERGKKEAAARQHLHQFNLSIPANGTLNRGKAVSETATEVVMATGCGHQIPARERWPEVAPPRCLWSKVEAEVVVQEEPRR